MKLPQINTHNWAKSLALLLLALGILLRLLVYLQNRSLFLDEANLARNIAELNYLEFLSPLKYHQYAPPLFSWIEKTFWHLLGSNELGMRIFPLLVSFLGLFLFYKIIQQLFRSSSIWWFPLYLIAFSSFFIRYATEIKQYGLDATCTCLLLWLSLYIKPHGFSKKTALLWALAGCLMVWLSMPSVFILSGIGLYYLFHFWQAQKLHEAFWMLGAIGCWLLSFGIYFFTILKTDLGKDYLVDYHSTYFLPLLPATSEDWLKLGTIILSLFNTTIGYTIWAYLIGMTAFILGGFHLFIKDKALLILLGLPILLSLLASGLHLYSLIPRLTLFLIPVLILIITKGIEWLWDKSNVKVQLLLSLILLSIVPLQKGANYFFTAFEIEEIRPVLNFVHQNQKEEEFVYIYEDAIPAVQFYLDLHEQKEQFQIDGLINAPAYKTVDEVISGKEDKRIWLVFSHLVSDFSREQVNNNRLLLNETHQLEKKLEVQGAATYLYIPKK